MGSYSDGECLSLRYHCLEDILFSSPTLVLADKKKLDSVTAFHWKEKKNSCVRDLPEWTQQTSVSIPETLIY